jgi:hypothetical protein
LTLFRKFLRDFRIFNNTVFTITNTNNTNGLFRSSFTNNLDTTISSLGNRVTDENGIGNTSKTVINTVTMRIKNAAFL